MIPRSFLFLSALFCTLRIFGQTVELTGGSMHVGQGTTLRFVGPLTFAIQPGAEVNNDGTIELGTAATLIEPTGGPITGSGTEIAVIDLDGPIGNEEPGGLGLSLTTDFPVGPVTITRGHEPRFFLEGDQSIARWFRIDAQEPSSGVAQITMKYDAVELNGLPNDGLALFRSDVLDGPWAPISSTNDPLQHLVEGSTAAPWGVYTAFDANAPTSSPSLMATNGIQVWPTLTTDVLFIRSTDGTPLGSVLVFDGVGRALPVTLLNRSMELLTLDVGRLATGSYYVRIREGVIVKFRKA